MAGVAVKVTELPAHIVVALALTLTVGVVEGDTTIVTAFEVAAAGEAQAAFEVITTVTTSPFTNDVEVKVAELVPALLPFTFHW